MKSTKDKPAKAAKRGKKKVAAKKSRHPMILPQYLENGTNVLACIKHARKMIAEASAYMKKDSPPNDCCGIADLELKQVEIMLGARSPTAHWRGIE